MKSFETILIEHQMRYPLMQPQDYVKLAYQSEFGAEHMLSDTQKTLRLIQEEWNHVWEKALARFPENIGEGFSRFHLTRDYDKAEAAPLLAKLFSLTAAIHHGTRDGLRQKLNDLTQLNVCGMESYLDDYRKMGYPAVRHSFLFQDAYHPHYRVLKIEYSNYFPTLLEVWKLIQKGKPATVAIDGRCGSGKTGLTELLTQLFPCNVVHMDDFFLPVEHRSPDWEQQSGGNMDLDRFRTEILKPLADGCAVDYRAYDCRNGHLLKPVTLPFSPLTIVEGSYAHHPALLAKYDLRIFLTCSKEEQNRRLRKREPTRFDVFAHHWIPMEERYFQSCNVASNESLIVDTSDFFDEVLSSPDCRNTDDGREIF